MVEFARGAGDASQDLEEALDSERPFASFIEVAEAAGVRRLWHREQARRVRAVIHEWAREHGITVDIDAEPLGSVPKRRTTDQADPSLSYLRRLAHRAVERMEREELLRLPVRLGDIAELD
jgi:hypothetical protein